MHNLLPLLTILLAFALSFISTGARADNICSDTSSNAEAGTLYDSGGSSGNYGNRENCTFLIQPSSGTTITLVFSQFNVQNADQLKIYNGTTTSAPVIATLTGNNLPTDVVADSGAMLISFISNAGGTRPGFAATWSTNGGATNGNWLCSDSDSTDSTGTLYDSGGPSGNYSNREDCNFLIHPTGGGIISLNFLNLIYKAAINY